ncbi:MAG: ABC transporter ATP-binding protein [Planctomycetota bacterium]
MIQSLRILRDTVGRLGKSGWPLIRSERRSLRSLALLSLFTMSLALALPYCVQQFLDTMMSGAFAPRAVGFGGALVGVLIAGAALTAWQRVRARRLQARVRFRLTRRLIRSALAMNPVARARFSSTQLLSRIRDDVRLLDGVLPDRLLGTVFDAVKLALLLGALLLVDTTLALFATLTVLIACGLLATTSLRLRRLARTARESDATSNDVLHELLAAQTTIRAAATESEEAHRAGAALQTAARDEARRDIAGLAASTSFRTVSSIGLYVVLAIGAWRVSAGLCSVGALSAAFVLLGQMLVAAGSLLAQLPNLQNSLASLDRVLDVLGVANGRARCNHPPARTHVLEGQVELQDVQFRHETTTPCLEGVSLSIPAGTRLVLVGANGSGKSTIGQVLTRLLEPTRGDLRFDGCPASQIASPELRRQIGWVAPETFIFNRSLFENLRYRCPRATLDQVRDVARMLGVEKIAHQLPDGYATVLGERGFRLSAGERQRVALAREILARPNLLILDHATTHLDETGQAQLEEALRVWLPTATVVAISHDLASFRHFDRIATLASGKIVTDESLCRFERPPLALPSFTGEAVVSCG